MASYASQSAITGATNRSAVGGAAPAASRGPWRQFKFFSQTQVRDHHDASSDAPETVGQPALVSAVHAQDDIVLKADIHGSVQQLNPDYDILRSWDAYKGGRCTHITTSAQWRGIVITVGDEPSSPSPVVKVWAVDLKNSATQPRLLRSARVDPSSRPHPVTSVAITPSLSHIVLGLAEGTVVAFKHVNQLVESSLVTMQQQQQHSQHTNEASNLTNAPVLGLGKLRTLHESKEPVTGLDIVGDQVQGGKRSPATLFIVTTSRVLSYPLSSSSSKATAVTLDTVGADVECCAAIRLPDGDKVIVARDEAIYVYSADGREGCYAYEGSKSSLKTLSSNLAVNPPTDTRTIYLAIVTPPQTASIASNSATIRNFARNNHNNGSKTRAVGDVAKVTIFDPVNKFVAFSSTFEEGVKDLWEAWGAVWVLTDAGQLYRLAEQPLQTSLSELFSRNLFTLAASLAQSRGVSASEVAEIQRRYGDYLYGKGDFEGSIACYIKTVGTVQPSYVIRKFLHAQRLSHLTSYLQELHSQGLANSDHTTLLLNCYTKLADDQALSDFLHTSASAPNNKPMDVPTERYDADVATTEPPFDLETAIRVCRQAGYFDHAVWLAERYQEHSEYLRIQVEDRHDHQQALTYLSKLEPRVAKESLVKYGRFLLDAEPDKTTDLLIDLCCGRREDTKTSNETLVDRMDGPKANGVARDGTLSYLAYGTAAEPTSIPTPDHADNARPSARQSDLRDEGKASESLPPPQSFFALFADHPRQFIKFLETVAEKRYHQSTETTGQNDPTATSNEPLPEPRLVDGSKFADADTRDETTLWNTLIELWVSESVVEDDASIGRIVPRQERLKMQSKALRTLRARDRIPYDETQALLVCTTYDFEDGFVLLYEQLEMYEEVVRYWIQASRADPSSASASGKVVQALRRYGQSRPTLYRTVLKFLTSDGDLLTRHHDDIVDILSTVEETNVLAPIAVVQILSSSGGAATVGLVREYLQRHLAREKQQIDADQGLIESYRTETTAKRRDIRELSDPDAPRVLQVTRCSACGGQLDLPAVHFMCRHSYHQRCLGDSTSSHETQCPTCARSHGVVQELRRAHEQSASDHDMFLQDVKESEDGFKAVADAFGRGALSFELRGA
ncbi:hypothetical protein ACM66B_006297 [Microbotryomycetes sp. NB124-2]